MLHLKQDFLPQTQKAQKIQKLIRESINSSDRYISRMFPTWDDAELNYRAYRPADEEDRESIQKYGVQKIIVPIQFATAQIITTFLMEVFNALKPTLRVRGADPASVKPAQLMELCLDYDYRGNRGYLMMQQWFLNALRYSYGVMHNQWGKRQSVRRQLIAEPASIIEVEGQEFKIPGPVKYTNDWYTIFEGNTWSVLDNRQWFPDPRVPITRFQDGHFCAHRDYIHDNDLRKMDEDGLYFNTKEIKATGSSRDTDMGGSTHRRDRFETNISLHNVLAEAKKNKMHVNEHIFITIIPKDYDLGSEDRPQEWVFNLIDDQYIVRAEESWAVPKFPYAVIEPYPDILAFMSQGLMELTQPLADHVNFLFNSHMANVRRVIKNLILADPSRVDLADVLDNSDGGIIRLLPTAYGTDPAAAVKQLQIQDVTSGHFQNLQILLEFWERITGATSQMFGQISSGRRTAYELQGVFRQAGSRMKMMADLMSSEGVAPLTEQMAMLRQENMTTEQFVRLAGKTAESLGVSADMVMNDFLNVSPKMISGVFTFPAEEGVLPYDRAAAAEILEDVFGKVAQFPFLTQAFDPVAIFKELMRQKGLHHIDEFLQNGLKTESMIMTPDQLGELYASKKIQPATPGRPDEGVRQDAGTLTMEGLIGGAGASYNGGPPRV
jgi:hypothetical protein